MPSRLDRLEDKLDAVQSNSDRTVAMLEAYLERQQRDGERLDAVERFVQGAKGVAKAIAVLASVFTLTAGAWKTWESYRALPVGQKEQRD